MVLNIPTVPVLPPVGDSYTRWGLTSSTTNLYRHIHFIQISLHIYMYISNHAQIRELSCTWAPRTTHCFFCSVCSFSHPCTVQCMCPRFFCKKRGHTKFYMEGGQVKNNEGLTEVLNRTMSKKIGSVLRLLSSQRTGQQEMFEYDSYTQRTIYQRSTRGQVCLISYVWRSCIHGSQDESS